MSDNYAEIVGAFDRLVNPAFDAPETTDYSTSRFENAEAEKAYAVVLDGGSDESIYDGDSVAFDLVWIDGRPTILRYDSQGFVWLERSASDGNQTVMHAWRYLQNEYAENADPEEFA